MTAAVATWDQIVYSFQQIPDECRLAHNWGTAPHDCECNVWWRINDETYINGIPIVVDMDYIMGYLLEVVDRTHGTVHYGVVILFHGGKFTDWGDGEGEWRYEHDSMQYEADCGTFFNRTDAADAVTVGKWAVERIRGLVEEHLTVARDGKVRS